MSRDFKNHKEKNVVDCDMQSQPLHLLELFGLINTRRYWSPKKSIRKRNITDGKGFKPRCK